MREFVVTDPPASVVTAAEAKAAGVFPASDSDVLVQAALDAAQAVIDGPFGWLGRCIGEQEIQMTLDEVCGERIELFYPPVLDVIEVAHIAADGADTIFGDDTYWVILPGSTTPSLIFASSPPNIGRGESLRITYRAGYPHAPDRIKQAIMLMAKSMSAAGSASGIVGPVRSETVDGVGRIDYATMAGDAAAKYMDATTAALLGGYRIQHL